MFNLARDMKKAFWWILGLLLSPVLLFVALTILIYLPPVQNWLVDRVAEYGSEQTGMKITVDNVDLSFPIDLGVNGVRVIHQADTIADVRRMTVDVQLLPLIDSKVVVNQLEISDTQLNTNGFIASAQVKGTFNRLFVKSDGIDLNLQTVDVTKAWLDDARLDIVLNDSVPEDTTKSETKWKISVGDVKVNRSDVTLHMPGDTMSVKGHFGTLAVSDALIDLEQQTYTVVAAEWVNGALLYNQNFQPHAEGLDFNHIDLSNINITIDSIYFHDPTLRLLLRNAAMREKSGIQLTELAGRVVMENGSLRLPDFRLKTPESDILLALDMPLNLADSLSTVQVQVGVNAQLGKHDLNALMASMPAAFQSGWPDERMTIRGAVSGSLQRMEFSDLSLTLPTALRATATGFLENVTHPEQLKADVQFSAQTENLGFVLSLLPRDQQRNYRLPAMTAGGRLKADGADYQADINLREGEGSVQLKGQLNADAMRYNAQMEVSQLNLHHFMPRDSLYTLTADINASGQGTDFLSPRTSMTADAHVRHLRYGSWNFDNMTLLANVEKGHALVDVDCRNKLLDGKLNIDALLNTKKLNGTLTADINTLDAFKMRLVEKPLSIGLCGHVDITSDMKINHYVSGLISDITVRDSVKSISSEFIGLHVRTSADTTLLRVQSGDFIVKLDGSGNYNQLLQQLSLLTDSVNAQLARKTIEQKHLQQLLPIAKLHVESKRDNPLATILKSQDVDFQQLLFDMETSPETGINGNGYVHSLNVGNVRLDTINFQLKQRKRHLSFAGQIRNNKKNPQFVFNALFDGFLQEHGATFGVRYYDAANKLGARIGAKAELLDSGMNLHLIPETPTIGYKQYKLNKDNFVFIGAKNRVKANLDLVADDGMGVKVYSEDDDPTNLQDLTVSLNKFNLDEVTSVIPYAPRMTGMLFGDYHLVQDVEGNLSVASDMAINNLTYERSPIGNVSSEVIYMQKSDSAHAVEARLMKDNEEIGLLTGTYYNKDEGSLDAKLLLTHMPLNIVNGFVPDQLFGLQGYTDGEMTVRGAASKPVVNGELLLDSAYAESVPYGVTLRFDNDPVRVANSKLMLDNFTVYSHNKNPLNIQGSIDFSDPDRMMVDVRVRARDYQLINAKESQQSIAYGKAYVNVFAFVRGPVDNLNMRGRLELLGSTDVSYVLRDSPLSTDNQLDNLVKFKDFSDTTQVVVERLSLNGLSMDMTLVVSKGAHIMAYLNADHSNYIDLMGGGTLRMLYNPADNLRLTGRYTLSNGEMKYSLPVIPLKTFTIQNGSYIEFTGEPMNPTLNIKATERTKATVTNESGVGRSVDFDCGVIITKNLKEMGLEFTLDAPEDMQLHSELQSMGTDERGKLAVTMLTTGMYLSGGSTKAFSMNSALSSFLNSEITSITGNALRTLDLSFGMDQSYDASGQQHTDYSFKFAKRFMNNRLKLSIGGKVSTGAELQQRNNSFFDNVGLEYRLDDSANKYLTLFFQNNSYDWLDGYSQKYGGGFIWRRSIQTFWDIFRKDKQPVRFVRPTTATAIPADSLKTKEKHATK